MAMMAIIEIFEKVWFARICTISSPASVLLVISINYLRNVVNDWEPSVRAES